VHAGRKYKTMKASELDHYAGERGRRGLKLPRGYQNVEALNVE
jgi:topoisomerase IV subunit A